MNSDDVKAQSNDAKSLSSDPFSTNEKFLVNLNKNLIKFAQQTEKLKCVSDELIETILKYTQHMSSDSESSFKETLNEYAAYLCLVEESRNEQINQIHCKVLTRLKTIENDVKAAKENFKFKSNKLKKYVSDASLDSAKRNSMKLDVTEQVENSEYKTNQISSIVELFKELTHIQMIHHSNSININTLMYKLLLDNKDLNSNKPSNTSITTTSTNKTANDAIAEIFSEKSVKTETPNL